MGLGPLRTFEEGHYVGFTLAKEWLGPQRDAVRERSASITMTVKTDLEWTSNRMHSM